MPSLFRRAAGLLMLIVACNAMGQAPPKPKVRAITAFIRLDRAQYRQQVGDALKMLLAVRDEFSKAGYETETVRITTQPFPEYTRGLSRSDAVAFLREYDAFLAGESKRIGLEIDPNIGPAMMQDSDDPAAAELLTDVLSSGVQLNASIIVAGDDGIHWNAVRASARLIKNVADRSEHSQGTFNFAALRCSRRLPRSSRAPITPAADTSSASGWKARGWSTKRSPPPDTIQSRHSSA